MIQFVTKAVHKCAFCGRETESYDDIGYYVIDVYRKCVSVNNKIDKVPILTEVIRDDRGKIVDYIPGMK